MPLIPTNIITGFLGVGKTTLIRHLLANKPETERWAILVNEFGEVGIDGALLREQGGGGAAVKEIPGGCMCCTAGLPMQVGLTQLLRQQKFDRLLIEPSGLGHPQEVLDTLQKQFADVLDIKACLTLVDPRHFSSERHLGNDTFRQQLQVADALITTKPDLVSDQEIVAMQQQLQSWHLQALPHTQAEHGQLEQHWLDLPHHSSATEGHVHTHGHSHAHESSYPAATLNTPEPGQPIVTKLNQGQGYFSCGWAIHPSKVFALGPTFSWINGLACDRLKAVLITDQGIVAINLADGVVKMLELDECDDSRIEIIHQQELNWDELREQLERCLI